MNEVINQHGGGQFIQTEAIRPAALDQFPAAAGKIRGRGLNSHARNLLTVATLGCALVCMPLAAPAQQPSEQERLPRQNGTVPQERRPSPLPPEEQVERSQYPDANQRTTMDGQNRYQQDRNQAGDPRNDRLGQQDWGSSAVEGRETTRGTVVSSSRNTMVVRGEDGRHLLFTFDRDAERPNTIPVGSTVRVVSRTTSEGIRVASYVSVTGGPSATQGQGGTATSGQRGPSQPGTAPGDDPVPPEIRRLESQIERQMRRFRAGVRTGVGLDPEVVFAGVHANLGPFFHPDVWFRPNAEFGFGEVTKQFNLNLEAVYRLPVTERSGRWTMYAGAGPAFNFINRDFEAAQDDDRDIDFNDFDFEAGLNFLVGMENRNGMFFEFKGSAQSSPQVRFMLGYTF